MKTNKGYILPVILILLLLLLAGFFVFTQKVAESPVVEIEKPIIPENIKIATSTLESFASTSIEDLESEEISTSSVDVSTTSSHVQIENAQ